MGSFSIRLAASAVVLASGLCGTRCLAQTRTDAPAIVKDCARCHVVVANGPASWTDAPSFQSIANRPGMTRAWLTDFVEKQHRHMLTDEYTPAQANNIASYILGLRRK